MSTTSSAVQSAVSFLRDPSVADAPLGKKVAFLEAKGLSQVDIDAALRLAGAYPSPQLANTPFQQNPYGYGYPGQQQRRPPDWRDWFIMAVVGGAVGTGIYSLARKYLMPALAPPSQTELEAAQAALDAKYDEAAAILQSLQAETSEIKSTLNEQCERVDESVRKVEQAMDDIKRREEDKDRDFDKMRDDVESLKDLMERMFDKHKDAQSSSLSEIQQEVKSLRSLLGRRGMGLTESPSVISESSTTQTAPTAPSSSQLNPNATSFSASSSPFDSQATGRFGISSSRSLNSLADGNSGSSNFAHIINRPPGIPAWQLQSTNASGNKQTAPPQKSVMNGASVDSEGESEQAATDRLSPDLGDGVDSGVLVQ